MDGGPRIAVPHTPAADYLVGFDDHDRVTRISLLLNNENCFG